MAEENTNHWDLGSDRPLDNPQDDEFGYAPFANRLAKAIMANPKPHGLVLAVHGKWGSGKSSVLNFIKHDLNALPAEQRPVIIDFNPWWFEGREQIASQLLRKFADQLSGRFDWFCGLARTVGEYAEQIGRMTTDVPGVGWISKLAAEIFSRIPALECLSKKNDIASVKARVSKKLTSSRKRYVFFVDDIDRLTPEEARDLFRAIKALADFQEVVYVLFFDREQVSGALSVSMNMDGEAYLEKIIQASFHLPAVDKRQIRKMLFTGLGNIVDRSRFPSLLEQDRWEYVFVGGIDQFIKKPRDIIRILNAVSVTYPPLAGEVNPTDFIAIEVLRIFEPQAYDSVRDAKSFFCGDPDISEVRKEMEQPYFDKWRESLPERSRDRVTALVMRLFPRARKMLDPDRSISFDHSPLRSDLRVCSSELFDTYFQFQVPMGCVSRVELDQLVNEKSWQEIAEALRNATTVTGLDGQTKALEMVERLRDFDQLSRRQSFNLIEALVSVTHDLIPAESNVNGFTYFPTTALIFGSISVLLLRLSTNDREILLLRLAQNSPSLIGVFHLALEATRDLREIRRGFQFESDKFGESMVAEATKRLEAASLKDLMNIPYLAHVILWWGEWGNGDRIRHVFEPATREENQLLDLIDKFVQVGSHRNGFKKIETYGLWMNPLATAIDVNAVESRVRALQSRANLSERQKGALDNFLRKLQILKEGRDPDAIKLA